MLDKVPKSTVKDLLTLLVASSLVAWMGYVQFGSLRKSALGPIDDHELLYFRLLSRSGQGFVPILFNHTELGEWGSGSRFRPIYIAWTVLSGIRFADSVNFLYLTRIVLWAVTVIALTFILVRLLERVLPNSRPFRNAILATAGATVFAVVPSWADITPRLGPSEAFLAPAIVFLILLCFEMNHYGPFTSRTADRNDRIRLALVGALLIIAVGSKENGIVGLVPATVAIQGASRKTGETLRHYLWQRRVLGGWLAFSGVSSVLMFIGPAGSNLISGRDLYGSDTSVKQTASMVFKGLSNNIFTAEIAVIVLTSLTFLLVKSQSRSGGFSLTVTANFCNIKGILALYALCKVIIVSEFVFYRGSFTAPRYLIVTELCQTLCSIIVLLLVLASALRINEAYSQSLAKMSMVAGQRLTRVITLATTLVMFGWWWNESDSMAIRSHATVAVTSEWSGRIQELRDQYSDSESTAVLIHAQTVEQYEYYVSLRRFLGNARGSGADPNDFYLWADLPLDGGELSSALSRIEQGEIASWQIRDIRELRNSPVFCISGEPEKVMAEFNCSMVSPLPF